MSRSVSRSVSPSTSRCRRARHPRRGLVALAVAAALVAGCGDDAESDGATDVPAAPEAGENGSEDDLGAATDDPGATADDRADETDGPEDDQALPALHVVATVAPLADLVVMVGGERVEVAPLVPAGADSHTYEPRPQDVARLADADAYLGVGLDLNPAAIRLAEENVGDGVPIVLLGEVALTDDALVFDHTHGDDDHGHTHGDDDLGHTHGDDDHGHTHGDEDEDVGPGPNPHVWTSVRNAAAMVEAIADTLAELDPAGEAVYRDNAAAGQEQLRELDRLIGDATATIPAANRTLVTYHDAWTYFARDYRLEFATAVQPADFSDPSAGEVRDVIDLIREREVPAVFGSEVFPTPVLETIAEETGATYVGDLADDVLPGRPGDPEHTYLELMRRNAVAIVSGLGGDASQLEG